MKVRHAVSDDVLMAALKNEDNRLVVWSVLKRYAGQFSQQELAHAFPLIIYRTLGSHEDGYGQKFTTSLTKFAHWYMRNELASRRKHRRNFDLAVELRRGRCEEVAPDYWAILHDDLNEVLSQLPEGYRDILLDYYLGEMSLSELAKKYPMSESGIRDWIENALNVAREISRRRYHEVDDLSDPEAALTASASEEDEEW